MSGILVIAEQRRGELRPVSLELIGAAVGLKPAVGGPLAVALVGADVAGLATQINLAGVDEILVVTSGSGDYDPDTMGAAVGALISSRSPSLVLLPHSVDSLGYAATLAATTDCGFATDVFRIDHGTDGVVATRGGYGQKVNVEVDFPGRSTVVLAVRANVYKPPEGAGTATVSSLSVAAGEVRVTPRDYIELSSADDVDMTAAEFILTIGRGIGEESKVEQFRELADAVGATLGCSRPIADSGWLPKARQIGQSGKTASACKLYVAMGVSGAIQHLAGMKHVSTIVAVNTDPAASIFTVAKYGIVGDIFEVAEELRTHF